MSQHLNRLGGFEEKGRRTASDGPRRRANGWVGRAVFGVLLASIGCTGSVTGGGNTTSPGTPGTPGTSGTPGTTGTPGVTVSPGPTGVPGVTGGAPVPPGSAVPAGSASAASVADGTAFFPGTAQGLTKTRIWQLTPDQYLTTLSDALGVTISLPSLLPSIREEHFLNDATTLAVSDVSFADLEEGLRAELVTHQAEITARMGCAVAALNADCARTFLKGVATIAQGLSTPNVEPAMQVFTALTAKAGARPALDDALLALLMSPSVMFRTELGAQAGTAAALTPAAMVSLTPPELSRALAYTVTNGPPDAMLRTKAADGSLARPEVMASELARLQATPRGQEGLRNFVLDWVGLASYRGLEKNANVFPEFTPMLKQAMIQETNTFIDYVLRQRGGNFSDLMTLEQSFVDPQEASLYGLKATAAAGQLTTLPAGQRMGIFTQPAVLAMISDPALSGVIYRGKFMLERLLCLSLTPPKDVVTEFPDFTALGLGPDPTVRQRLATLENIAQCAGCHKLMHPLGFALEHYDAIGRYRADDAGKPIDASGSLTFTSFTKAPFQDGPQMLKMMADSPEVRACVTRQAFRYVFGRTELDTDNPVLIKAYQQFAPSGNVGALVTQLVSSSAFALRERTAP